MFDIVKYRTELRANLGFDIDGTTDLPDTDCDLLINRSYAWLLNEFKFRSKESTVVFPTIAGERSYELPDDFESLRGVSILATDTGQHTPLNRFTINLYEQKYNESVEDQTFPTDYLREGNCIKLWPTPDTIYSITLKYDRLLDDLGDIVSSASIPKNWEEFILTGAMYRGYIRLGDFPRAATLRKLLEADVAKAQPVEKKEEADSHLSGLQAIIPEYRV